MEIGASRQWQEAFPEEGGRTPAVRCSCLSGNRDFNLYNVILNPVNDIFVDARFIRKSVKGQMMFPGIAEDFLISFRDTAPFPFMEGSQVCALWHDVQPSLVW